MTDVQLAELVQERTSTAVKDALRRMGETPEPAPARKARAVAPVREPKAPKTPKAQPGVQYGLGLPGEPAKADLDAVRAVLDGVTAGLPKAELLAGCGLGKAAGAAALAALLLAGEVEKMGAGRGTKYRLGGGNHA